MPLRSRSFRCSSSVSCPRSAPSSHYLRRPPKASESARLEALIGREWEQRLADDPLSATYADRHDADGQMPTSSCRCSPLPGRTHPWLSCASCRRSTARKLQGAELVNYDLFGWQLKSRVEEWEVGQQRFPITSIPASTPKSPGSAKACVSRASRITENYLARIRSLPKYFAKNIELMRDGIRNGMVLPRISLEGYDVTISTHIVETRRREPLLGSLRSFPPGSSRRADADASRPPPGPPFSTRPCPFASFRDFLNQEYLPASRDSVGASEMKGGREYYAQRVRYFTTLDLSAEAGPPEGPGQRWRGSAPRWTQIIANVGFKRQLRRVPGLPCAPIRSSTPKPRRS